MAAVHVPVLLQKATEYMQVRDGGRYIDATAGQGGHLRELLKAAGPSGKVLAIDWDPEAITHLEQAFVHEIGKGTCIVVQGNFADVKTIAVRSTMDRADGILFDFGFSRATIENSGRGFSFQKDEPLVMAYDPHASVTAYDIVNETPEKELADIIFRFGEDRLSRRIAREIVSQRKHRPIETTTQLAECVVRAYPMRLQHARIHPATRTFQAIRIAVNRELDNIRAALPDAIDVVRSGGRVVTLAYHSLEDRIVKQAFRDAAHQGLGTIVTPKPVVPDPQEIAQNPSSRSAKLRAFEKK